MTEGISALGGMSGLSLVDAIFDKTSSKDDDKKSGDIFDLMFQAIDESLLQTQENTNNIDTNTGNQTSDFNFGPPANITIENFDYSAQDSSSGEEFSITEATDQPSGAVGGSGESDDDDDDETSYNPMDLNQDGTVSIDEMLSYFEANETYNSQDQKNNSTNQFEQIFDMLV